jgi:hypothetical protein
MQIKIKDPQIISTTRFDLTEFNMFQSCVNVDGVDYTFSRQVKNRDWMNSQISVNGEVIGYGEDPRAFNYNGKPACYSVLYRDGLIPQIYYKEDGEWKRIEIKLGSDLPQKTPMGPYPGKNWGPVVYKSELYFIHSVCPFRLLKLNGDTVNLAFEFAIDCDKDPYDGFPIFRSGTNGLEILDGIFMGFGHDKIRFGPHGLNHKPFVWFLNMLNKSAQIFIIPRDWHGQGFNIIDASSFYIKDGKYYFMTSEAQTDQANPNQEFRSAVYEIEIEGNL